MSDPLRSFESLLKKQCNRSSKSLYNSVKQQTRPTFTPQDVISSVSSQLKAIKVAESCKINQKSVKDLNKYKSSTYLTVNKLPMYEELPKPSTKFDTQCVTDTQLINVIEDAEILDRYQGMTDAFATPFSQIHTEKQTLVGNDNIDLNSHKESNIMSSKDVRDEGQISHLKHNTSQLSKIVERSDNVKDETGEHDTVLKYSNRDNVFSDINQISHSALDPVVDNENMELDSNVINNIEIDEELNPSALGRDTEIEEFSQILNTKTFNNNRLKTNKTTEFNVKNTFGDNYDAQIEEHSQILNQCKEIETDEFSDISPSPIFPINNMKIKSKTPSPLVFNLDRFEHFENMAISLLESNEFNTAKHIINSQLMNKELHIQMGDDIELKERDLLSPVFQIKRFDNQYVRSPIIHRDKQVMEIDKATSEEILKQLTLTHKSKNNADIKMENSVDVFQDEILFSSDEEEGYEHKEIKDLPFTCALETSFYDQSDVLDKTMYVGFQTASNRSIQVSAESFVKAKSLLSRVTVDELTVTDLVKNCDNSLKDTKSNINVKYKELNFPQQDIEDSKTIINTDNGTTNSQVKQAQSNKDSLMDKSITKQNTIHNFMGFTTANNKKINLSKKALARCKKVFQDIDLSQNFDTGNKNEDLINCAIDCETNVQEIKPYRSSNNVENTINQNTVDDVLQGIDDVIMQEFENIEMEDDKPPDKEIHSTGFKTASKKDIKISDVALAKKQNVFEDIELDDDINENNSTDNKDQNLGDIVLSQIIGSSHLKPEANFDQPSTSKHGYVGFKTGYSNDIKISEDALAETMNIFDDINANFESNLLDSNKYDATTSVANINQPSTSKGFVGFKTANNKNICISTKAWQKCKNIFNDLDSIDLPKKSNKDYPEINQVEENKAIQNDLNEAGSTFVELKTTSNRNIDISKEALTKTKKISNNIDSVELEISTKLSRENEPKTEKGVAKKYGCDVRNTLQSIVSETKFVGFQTANNKSIKISNKALAKSKNIFKDIDVTDFVLSDKKKKDYPDFEQHQEQIESKHTSSKDTRNHTKNVEIDVTIQDVPHFKGFKTASNKQVKVSSESVIKTKNIFKDIDATESALPNIKPTHYPDIVQNQEIREYKQSFNNKTNNNAETEQAILQFQGFITASNKQIQVSKESLIKTKNIFKDIDSADFTVPNIKAKDYADFTQQQETTIHGQFSHDNMHNTPINKEVSVTEIAQDMPQFQGFKTASNKQVKVSKESVIKTKNIFKGIDSGDFTVPNTKPIDYPVFSEQQEIIKYGQFSHNKVHKSPKNKQVNATEIAQEIPQFQGFKTASNKQVKVSKESLIKTKNIFKDIDSIDFAVPRARPKDYPEIDRHDKTKEDIRSARKSSPYDEKGIDFNKPVEISNFQGFQTASNKQVKISNEALIKSKNIFKDLDNNENFDGKYIPNEDGNNTDRPTSPLFKAYQMANKNPVAISAKALEKNKISFEDLQGSDKTAFSGFQTASNKQVKISEKALAKSRNIFKDIECSNNRNTDVKTKAKGLYPEEIYQHEENIEDVNAKSTFLGFQTCTNKVVQVSEKALTETKTLLDIDKCSSHSFKGFATASNKKVNVSEAKSKDIFQDFNSTAEVQDNKSKTTVNFSMAFQTGNKKPVAVSNEAIARSKRIFAEIDGDESMASIKKEKMELSTKTLDNYDIHAIIDTQVINTFEESLHTEDFHETSKKSKRSGSPILSCPRAKRRKKFETPYSIKNVPKQIIKPEEAAKDENILTFREDYKKKKKYTLKDLQNMAKNVASALDPYLRNFDYDTLHKFEFKDSRNELSSDSITTDLLKEKFLTSVNSKLVPGGWLANHIKLIIWKLISYEIRFKSLFCTARNVLDQLKYRYDRELYNAQRPALRKIFEKDDVPSKTLVLCVAGIYVDGVRVSSVSDCPSNMELLLTDGWYCIRCVIDKMLTQLVCSNKIQVGSKIVTSGAELSGCEQGVAPWEDTSAVRLKIFGNSTRRAKWDARLGYHGNGAILSPLSSVTVLGGKVAKLRAFVARVYPALYVEKFEDGSTVTRSERLENLHQMKTEAERQTIMEKIYEEVEMEFADKDSQDSEGLSDSYRRPGMDSGSQIARLMKRSKDPAEFRAQLTESQSRLLEAHTSRNREKLLQDIQTRVRDGIEKAGVCVNRNVVSLLKIRIVGVQEKGDRVDICKGMMSIWKPNDAIREIVKEGTWIDVMNVVPTAVRYSEIQISAGRQSVFSTSNFKPPEKFEPYIKLLQRQCYSVRDLAQNPVMSTDYNEIDTVGLIFLIDPSMDLFDSTRQSFQNIYLTDTDKNIICVNFWGGLKKFGFQNVLDTGQIVACVNLQKRAGNTRKSTPQYRVTELSYFTQTPKSEGARKMLLDLNKKISGLDRRKFCDECVVLKNNYAVVKQNNENVSPYRFMNNTEINMSKNKMFIDSPLAGINKVDDNFNLTGLDFESTFKQDSELSEEALKRKRKVNEKIARLKMYGEPPPLSPVYIINRSKQATSSYKSPLLTSNNNSTINRSFNENTNVKYNYSDSSKNVASVINTPQNCEKVDCDKSPVLLNRTYVKSVNPVKINFDVKDINDSNVDHFAEEFDGSPPLSLD